MTVKYCLKKGFCTSSPTLISQLTSDTMFVLCDVSRSITVEMSERWRVMGTHVSGLHVSGLEGKAERPEKSRIGAGTCLWAQKNERILCILGRLIFWATQ